MTTTYICAFRIGGGQYFTETDQGVAVFVNGFWVDSAFKLTNESDAKWWIPPGKIDHVYKEVTED